jgi:hypothetical protein
MMVRQESLNGLQIIEFLLHLGHVVGNRLLVIWDGSPIHRRAQVMEFLAKVGRAIHQEVLPPYARTVRSYLSHATERFARDTHELLREPLASCVPACPPAG